MSEITSNSDSSNRSRRALRKEGKRRELKGPNFPGLSLATTTSADHDDSPRKPFLLFEAGPEDDLTQREVSVGPHKEITQISKARHLKLSEDFGKIMNKDLRGLQRHYRGRNSIHKYQDILYGSKHPKRRRNKCLRPRNYVWAPRVWSMRPDHGPGAPSMKKFEA